jgi:hypothetical protein
MHYTMSDGVDSCAADLLQPIYNAERSSLMVSDVLRLLKLVPLFIAHPDACARPDFLENTMCKPPGICRLSTLFLDLNQLELQ